MHVLEYVCMRGVLVNLFSCVIHVLDYNLYDVWMDCLGSETYTYTNTFRWKYDDDGDNMCSCDKNIQNWLAEPRIVKTYTDMFGKCLIIDFDENPSIS